MINYSQSKKIIFDLDQDEKLHQFKFKEWSMYFIFKFSIENKIYLTSLENHPVKKPFFKTIRFIRSKIKNYFSQRAYLKTFDQLSSVKESPVLFIGGAYALTSKGHYQHAYFHFYDIITYFRSKNIPINYVYSFVNTGLKKHSYIDAMLPLLTNGFTKKISKDEINELRSFLDYLSELTSTNYRSYFYEFLYYLMSFNYKVNLLEKYITKTNCHYLFCISVYNSPWILAACKKTNIKCVELQHGFIHPDLTYFNSSSYRDSVLFPDYILILGNEWKKMLLDYF